LLDRGDRRGADQRSEPIERTGLADFGRGESTCSSRQTSRRGLDIGEPLSRRYERRSSQTTTSTGSVGRSSRAGGRCDQPRLRR
jgi:hypothetical protein